jgi:hypothetical protein
MSVRRRPEVRAPSKITVADQRARNARTLAQPVATSQQCDNYRAHHPVRPFQGFPGDGRIVPNWRLHRWHGCRRLASARAWRRSSCAQLSTTPGSGPLESQDLQVQHSATWSSVIIAFDQRRQLGFAISDTARPADSPVWEAKKLSACILDSLILVRSETPNRQRSRGWGHNHQPIEWSSDGMR